MHKKRYTVFDCIFIPFMSSKKCAFVLIAIAVIGGLIPSIQTLVVARFIDTAIRINEGAEGSINIFGWILAIIGCIFITWMSDNVKQLYGNRLEIDLRNTFRVMLTDKRSKIKYQFVEDPKTWDLVSRVTEKPELRLKNAFIQFFDFIGLIIEIVGLILIFITQSWTTAIIIVTIGIPIFITAFKSGKMNYDVKLETQKYHRKHEYLAELLTSRDAAQERSIFGYSSKIGQQWYEWYEKARKVEIIVKFKWFVRMKSTGVIASIICIITTLILIPQLVDQKIKIGIFIALINATYSLVNNMTWNFTSYVESIANNSIYMKELTNLMDLEEFDSKKENIQKGQSIKELLSIEFLHVKFKYPGTENYILKDFSYRFERDKKYALIGVNGAGKTTLLKLLIGLYDEYEGKILINGMDIKDISFEDKIDYMSVVYQDFAKYNITLKDNVVIGRIKDQNKENIDSVINKLMERVGLREKVNSLENGIYTKLGKFQENGQDLSGGEWQKLALARALVGKAELFILDEPTSAMDPVAESAFYGEFFKICDKKMVILISHRLGAAVLVDHILVLNNGSLAEYGTHKELMKSGKIYAQMYESQRGWYSDEENEGNY
ncbi:ABC transporter ATP-binding protein [Anaerocolumna sp. AGMB13025]|uniref:ATP-binding cassette domain-containing protein n=1 Tax=Anaerocolumna sp. AGMB13025 TaxID=3039116 RepID=UPI00241DC62F|nr:ABC transporter ATP-binding protein [Anaerocolumna sp. AGMB13025]WFR57119.1 ABC transporter ATP-binding protein [Anaerocolumna sp. AGMB13025]